MINPFFFKIQKIQTKKKTKKNGRWLNNNQLSGTIRTEFESLTGLTDL